MQKKDVLSLRKILLIILAITFICKAEGQKSYEFEVDGIGYTLISPGSQNTFWTVAMTDIIEEMIDVVVPEQVTYNGQTMDVVKIDLWDSDYPENKEIVKSIAIPNNVSSVHLVGFVNLISIAPIDRLQELKIAGSSISQLTIPNSIQRLGIAACYSLQKLIILDGNEELEWVSASGLNTIDTLYCGRNMDLFHAYSYSLNLKSLEIGDRVTDLYLPHISDSLECLFVPKNLMDAHTSFHYGNWQEVVIEDTYGDLINSENHNSSEFYRSVFGAYTDEGYGLSCKKLYIGRNIPIFGFIVECEQLICGPLTEYISLWGYTSGFSNEGGLEITGDSAYIKIYRRTPPEITTASYYPDNYFKNDTYLNTPLYVPRGSLDAYRNSSQWGLFFNIIEFDWDEPYYQISASGNSENIKITGDRIYHEGDTATLRARWQGSNYGNFVFYCWKENGEIVSRDNPYSFVVEGERSLEACYVSKDRPVYIKAFPMHNVYPYTNNLISYKAENDYNQWNDVYLQQDSTRIGSFRFGSVLYLKATPKDGDSFLAWKDEYGIVLSEDTEYSFEIELSEKPLVLTAVFKGTGVEEEIPSMIQTIVNGRLISIVGVDANMEIKVFNGLGQIVYQGFDKNIWVYNAGVYIVAIENKRIKVIVE